MEFLDAANGIEVHLEEWDSGRNRSPLETPEHAVVVALSSQLLSNIK